MPLDHPRTAIQRHRIVRNHVTRAAADHEHLASLRAKVFPTSVMTGPRFDVSAARREGRKLTVGYRKQVKRVRRARKGRRGRKR
jgi:hypothetical protein